MKIPKIPVDPEFKKEVEKCQQTLLEVKKRISEFRKKGKDMTIPQLKVLNVPAKIRLADVTQDRKELEKVNFSIAALAKEIEEWGALANQEK